MILSLTKGWIGVDLGAHTVKLAQVERRGGRIRLRDALVLRRHETWDADADVSSADEIRAALSLGGRFMGRDAAVILPMAVCDVRGCRIDTADTGDVRGEVLRQLDAIYGDTLATHDVDYWHVGSSEDRDESGDNTLALTIPNIWTDRVAQDMGECGLIGHVLDGLPMAIARAVALGSPRLTEPVVALDWGYQNATLCIVLRGQPVFVRGLRDGGFASIVATLSRSLDVSEEEAQKLMREWGLPDRNATATEELQSVIEEVIREPLSAFMEEVDRTITFLNQQRRAIAPTKIILFGGGASVKNIASYFQSRMELPVEGWRLRHGGDETTGQIQPPIEMLGPAIALSSLAWATT